MYAGYKLKLIMPANMSEERRAAMAAYGAELISVPAGKMELARDLAHEMQVPHYHPSASHSGTPAPVKEPCHPSMQHLYCIL